jgi:hypothetical protein
LARAPLGPVRSGFAACTENSLDPFAPQHLMAIDPTPPGTAPSLREVGPLSAVGLPNGLASDHQGHLYYAATGLLVPGSVHRVTLSGTAAVVSDVVAIQHLLENPNGLKIGAGHLYVGTDPVLFLGMTRLLRYPLSASGPGLWPTVIATSAGLYDDFTLVADGGLLAAEFLLGQVRRVDEASGLVTASLAVAQPTSATVVASASCGERAVLVTRRSAGAVDVFTDAWGLEPR